MSFLYMNLSAAFMILAIIGVRAICKNKVPYIAIWLLWGLAVMRLCIPFHLESNFSIYNGIYHIRRWLATSDFIQVGHNKYYFDRVIYQLWAMPEVKVVVFGIWIVGASLISHYYLKDYRICRTIWKTAEESPLQPEMEAILSKYDCCKVIRIRQSNQIDCPVACGIFYHGIIIPTNLKQMDQKKFEQMLLHEYMHHKYMHPLLEHILVMILCLNWFNPMIWLFYFYVNRDMEILCDNHVLHVIGEEEKAIYARNLLDMASVTRKEYILYKGFAKQAIRERIVAIMKFKRFSALAVVFSMFIPTTMASAFCTDSNYVFGDEINDSEMIVLAEKFSDEEMIYVTYEELLPYITVQETKATSKINIERYARTYTSPSIPDSIKVSMERNGYTYSGTLQLVEIDRVGSKYIGYYSGTLYRE